MHTHTRTCTHIHIPPPDTPVPGKAFSVKPSLLCPRLRLRHSHFCAVGLAAAGHGVAYAGTSGGVHTLHDDKWPLLEGGHSQVPVIGHRLQETAIPRPYRISHLQYPYLVVPHLEQSNRNVGWKKRERMEIKETKWQLTVPGREMSMERLGKESIFFPITLHFILQ